jgi:hypothetical protein
VGPWSLVVSAQSPWQWRGLAKPITNDEVTTVPTQEPEYLEIEAGEDDDEEPTAAVSAAAASAPALNTTPKPTYAGVAAVAESFPFKIVSQ